MEAVAGPGGDVPFDHHTSNMGAVSGIHDVRALARSCGPRREVLDRLVVGEVRRLAIDSERFTVTRAPGRPAGLLIPAPPGAETRPRFVPGEADGVNTTCTGSPSTITSRSNGVRADPDGRATRHLVLDRSSRRLDVAHDLVAPIRPASRGAPGTRGRRVGAVLRRPDEHGSAHDSEEYETVKATFDAAGADRGDRRRAASGAS